MGLWSLGRDGARGTHIGGADSGGNPPSASRSDRAQIQNSVADAASPSAFDTRAMTSSGGAAIGPAAFSPSAAHSDRISSAFGAARQVNDIDVISPVAVLDTRRVTTYERFLKPALDKVFALVLLVVFSPLLLVVAVMVARSLGRPIVLRQQRVGRGGELFILHKFRTMHPSRRQRGLSLVESDRRVTHKHPDDPRLTSVGRTLRKWSLDELPQLWDVVTGKLSLVGPRPELECIVARYEPWQHGRHAVKPGLTGLWQIEARGDGEMHEHTDLDIEYVQRVTLRNDMKIMLLTIPAILARKGY